MSTPYPGDRRMQPPQMNEPHVPTEARPDFTASVWHRSAQAVAMGKMSERPELFPPERGGKPEYSHLDIRTLENNTGKGIGSLAFDQRRALPCLEDNPAFNVVSYDFASLQRAESHLGLLKKVKGRVVMEKMLGRKESSIYNFSEAARQDAKERDALKKFNMKNFLPNSVKSAQQQSQALLARANNSHLSFAQGQHYRS